MSIKEVKVPQLSESVAEATLLQWKKQPGQAVAADEILIEIETDKVVLEVPAPAAGVLTEIIKADGSTVVSDELIAKIDTEAKAGAAAPAASATAAPAQAAPAAAAPVAQKTTGTVAMPSAAKLMAETGVSVSQGTGKDGRVTKGDVIAAASAPKATVASSLPAAPSAASSLPAVPVNLGPEAMLEGRPEQRVPMSRLRARV
ncbi:MAG: biotin/lipoyl-containing protein, partial [Burkholderiaceae bacterium]